MRAVRNAVSLVLLLVFFHTIAGQVFIFELPELIVKMNTTYLAKQHATKLRCEIFDNIANLTFRDVYWIKDSLPVTELPSKKGGADLQVEGNELVILRGTHHTEGEYQCATVIEDIPLTETTNINTRLISAPVRLRKARITRFESFRSPTIRVRQGQVARLPCLGMPDVVPGPPDVWMEREKHESVALGMTSNLRFVSTPNGLQIAIAQPSDSGKYFCVVRNTHTNQTRKAPLPVILTVDSKHNFTREKQIPPMIVYPELPDYSKPVIVHAVVGQRVVLECVIWHSQVVWNNADYTMAPVSLTDETARIRQIWGNLRFKHVQLNDSGLYECHGLHRFDDRIRLQDDDHPRVRFLLKVHAPTNVNLVVAQSLNSRYLQMSCFVNNSGYEIPMVYVNGDPLVDAMERLGIPPQPNFFTNPVNVTLASSKALAGSVQCISKPAMDEAEIYGDGLERGRSSNLYVTDRSCTIVKLIEQGPTNVTKTVNSDAQLTCVPAASNVKVRWLKNNERVRVESDPRLSIIGSATLMITKVKPEDQAWYTCEGFDPSGKSRSTVSAFLEVIDIAVPTRSQNNHPMLDLPLSKLYEEPLGPLVIFKPRAFVASGQNVRLQWGLPSNHPQLIQLVNFEVELRKHSVPEANWLRADIQVQSHVRAVTVRNLVPRNQYQFRIIGNLANTSKVTSPPTDWMEITQQRGELPQPNILTLMSINPTTVQLAWEYLSGTAISEDDKFHISYQSINASFDDRNVVIVTGVNQALISSLEPNTDYAFSMYASNEGAQSVLSAIKFVKTFDENQYQKLDNGDRGNALSAWQFFRETYLLPVNQSVSRFVAVVVLTSIVVVSILCISCIFVWWLCSKSKKCCVDGKGFERQKRIRFSLDEKTPHGPFGIASSEASESSPLNFDSKEERDNYPFYANQSSPPLQHYVNTTNCLEMQTARIRSPKIGSNEFALDDVSPSRISLDTVVGMRAESVSNPYSFGTLRKNNNALNSYVNVGSSEANLYSTVRRARTRRLTDALSTSTFTPVLPPKVEGDSVALLDGTNHAYSPESSISPISHSSLNGAPEVAKDYRSPPAMSTFRPAQTNAPLTGSSLTLDRRRMHESVAEGFGHDQEGLLPEGV